MDRLTMSKRALALTVEGCRYEDGRIGGDRALPDEISKEPLVLFKHVSDPKFLEQIRSVVTQFPFRRSNYTPNDDGLPMKSRFLILSYFQLAHALRKF